MTGPVTAGPGSSGPGSSGPGSSGLQARFSCRRGDFELAVELTAAPGEIVGILGPNGAGKSTLLRAIAGLEPLESGRIEVAGTVLADHAAGVWLPAEDRRVGFVFQDYRLFPHLSVLDNVAYGARLGSRKGGDHGPAHRNRPDSGALLHDHHRRRLGLGLGLGRGRGPARGWGVRRKAGRAAAAAWLDRLGIADLAPRRPDGLSGGQAQRVALARALASSPSLVLLDEPLAALDAHTRLETRGQLRDHLAGYPGPSLVVTHDAIEALVLADRLVVVEAGRVVQTGRPVEIARRPATPYVARLMGLNLYRGRVTDPATGLVTLAGPDGRTDGRTDGGAEGGGHLECGPLDPAWAASGAEALVALAPSAIALHLDHPGPASPRNVWPGTVEALELLTDRVRVRVAGTPEALVDVTPAAVAELRLAPGARVWLTAKASEIEAYPAP